MMQPRCFVSIKLLAKKPWVQLKASPWSGSALDDQRLRVGTKELSEFAMRQHISISCLPEAVRCAPEQLWLLI